MAAGLMIPTGPFGNTGVSVLNYFPSGATLANGDLVTFQANALQASTAGQAVLGVLIQNSVTASTMSALVNITPGLRVVMDSSSTGIVSTDPGKYFDLTGGTGLQLIDITTRDTTYTGAGSQKTLICVLVNPQGLGVDAVTTAGQYILHKRQINT